MPVSKCQLVYGKSNTDRLTRLDNINTNILNAGLNLLSNKVGRNDVDSLDALGVLRSEGRGGRHGVAAMSGDDLLVSFKSATSEKVSKMDLEETL